MALFEVVPPRRWTPVRILGVVAAQVVGAGVAFVAGFLALLLLPPTGFFGIEHTTGDRLWGAVAALVAAATLPAGLWIAALLRRDRRFAVAGGLVSLAVVLLAIAVATST